MRTVTVLPLLALVMLAVGACAGGDGASRVANPQSSVEAAPLAKAVTTPAASSVPVVAPPASPFTEQTLGNGIRVIVEEDHKSALANVTLGVSVGLRDDPAGRSGMVLLLGSAMRNGPSRSGKTIQSVVEEAKWAADSDVTPDDFFWTASVPPTDLDALASLLADRLTVLDRMDGSQFTAIQSSGYWEQRSKEPYAFLAGYWIQALYPEKHPYHGIQLVPENQKEVESLSRYLMQNFYRDRVGTEKVVVVVSGNVDHTLVFPLLEKTVGAIPKQKTIQIEPTPPPVLESEVRLEIAAKVPAGRLLIGWLTPRAFAPGDAEMDLLGEILEARLTNALVQGTHSAGEIFVTQNSLELGSTFRVRAAPRSGHTSDELLVAIDAAVALIKTTPPSRAELDLARAHLLEPAKTALGHGQGILAYAKNTHDPNVSSGAAARYGVITAENIRQAAVTFLGPRRAIAVVTPNASAPTGGVLKSSTAKKVPPQ